MRIRLAFTLLASLGIAAPPAGADTPPGKHWIPMPELSDEFNSETLAPHKWETTNPYYPGKKPGMYVPENVRIRNGMLELWARAENPAKAREGYHGFTVAYLASKQKLRYGYLEVRAKPMAARIDCGFWLYRWTETGTYEIDIFEIGATSPGHENVVHTNLHYYLGDPALENDRNRQSAPLGWNSGQSLAQDFHTYGLEWDEREIRFYFDDRPIRSVPNRQFHHAMSVRFSAETQPDWFGLPQRGELPAAFLVDYLRVWRDAADPTNLAPNQPLGKTPAR